MQFTVGGTKYDKIAEAAEKYQIYAMITNK
jgi:hypothetical protein